MANRRCPGRSRNTPSVDLSLERLLPPLARIVEHHRARVESVRVVLAARRSVEWCDQALTAERLFGWHASLFPTGRSGMHRITVGAWRDDRTAPIRWRPAPWVENACISKHLRPSLAKTRCHGFSSGSNTNAITEPVLKAALAHLWFVTIHPFDDSLPTALPICS